jgi:hypothetical protein
MTDVTNINSSMALQMLADLTLKHKKLQDAYNKLAISSETPLLPPNNESGACLLPDHAESPSNEIILSAMIVIVTLIIIITISFEYAKEEWERRMHASLKAVVKNVFCKSHYIL